MGYSTAFTLNLIKAPPRRGKAIELLAYVGVAQPRCCAHAYDTQEICELESGTGEESTTCHKLNDCLYCSTVYNTWHFSSVLANCACAEECARNLQKLIIIMAGSETWGGRGSSETWYRTIG